DGVGRDGVVLECERRAGPTQPRLDLSEDQKGARPIARRAQVRKPARRSRANSAFTLDRLDEDRRRLAVDRARGRLEIAERRDGEAGNQRTEWVLVARLDRRRERSKGPPVKGALEDEDLPAAGPGAAHDLESGLDRLGPRVAEEGALHTGRGREPLGEADHRLGPVEVACVEDAA